MDSLFTNALIYEDYLKVRGKNDRINYLFQDWRPGAIAHQGAHQGVPFHSVNQDYQFKMVQGRPIGRSRNPTLNSEQPERPIDGVEERVVLRQEQRLATPQNYFQSVHSQCLRRQVNPLGGSGSG